MVILKLAAVVQGVPVQELCAIPWNSLWRGRNPLYDLLEFKTLDIIHVSQWIHPKVPPGAATVSACEGSRKSTKGGRLEWRKVRKGAWSRLLGMHCFSPSPSPPSLPWLVGLLRRTDQNLCCLLYWKTLREDTSVGVAFHRIIESRGSLLLQGQVFTRPCTIFP